MALATSPSSRVRVGLRRYVASRTRWMFRASTRPATADDLSLLEVAVIDAAFPPSPRPPVAVALREPNVARMVDGWLRPGDAGVIALRGRRPVGAAWYRLFEADEIVSRYGHPEIPELAIAVGETYRGQGWGRMLLTALAEEAWREGHAAIDLQVGQRNEPAVALYRSFGFEHVGEPEGELLWMRCELPAGGAPTR